MSATTLGMVRMQIYLCLIVCDRPMVQERLSLPRTMKLQSPCETSRVLPI